MRGRKPKPTHLKLVTGNPGKRKLNQAEPKPQPDMPAVPAHLTDEAKVEWDRVAHELHELGMLTRIDRAALAAYCQLYARWAEAERKIEEFGVMVVGAAGVPVPSPYVAVANKTLDLMRRYLVEFGMTPSSRSRITVGKRDGNEEDPAETYFG